MSAKLLGTIWELDLAPHLQPVLLALADHAKPDGSDCYPSVERVAWMIGKDERTVRRAFRELEALGLLLKESDGLGGRGRSTRYRIDVERAARKPAFRGEKVDTGAPVSDLAKADAGVRVLGSETRTAASGKGDTDPPERGTPVPPEPTENQQQPKEGTPPPAAPVLALELSSESSKEPAWNGGVILDAWMQKHPATAKALSERERGKLGAACKRLAESHTRDEVAAAFVGMGLLYPHSKGEPWDPMTLEDKFPKALAAAESHPKVRERQAAASLREDLLSRRRNGGR